MNIADQLVEHVGLGSKCSLCHLSTRIAKYGTGILKFLVLKLYQVLQWPQDHHLFGINQRYHIHGILILRKA